MNIGSNSKNDIILDFLRLWAEDLSQKAISLGSSSDVPEDLLATPAGQKLLTIAQAGQPGADRAEVADCVSDILAALFGVPGEAEYSVPPEFWETEIGALIAAAQVWAREDELVSMSEAAEISGKSLSALSQLVARGKLRRYPDPAELNPQKRNRLLRSEVEKLKTQHRAQ
jgi:hypothetical protein